MSFGDSSIHRRTCRNNKENAPKYAIGQDVSIPNMSPGGEGPLSRLLRALSHGEKGPKPKANMLQIGPNFVGVAHAVQKAYKTKIGPRRRLQGMATPLVCPYPYWHVLGPSLACYLLPPYPRQLRRCPARFNAS